MPARGSSVRPGDEVCLSAHWIITPCPSCAGRGQGSEDLHRSADHLRRVLPLHASRSATPRNALAQGCVGSNTRGRERASGPVLWRGVASRLEFTRQVRAGDSVFVYGIFRWVEAVGMGVATTAPGGASAGWDR